MTRLSLEQDGLLCIEAQELRVESREWGDAEVVALSERAPGKSGSNEDAALLLPLAGNALLLAVADGCGGMPAGADAAKIALGALARSMRAMSADEPSGAVLAGFDAANRAVLDMRTGSGTTLAAVLISESEARMFHVGDSSMLITGQRGHIRFNATQHSPTGFGVEAGLLTEHEAMRHEDRSYVLNIVGSAKMFVEISQPIRLRSRDTVLLASDGLTDNLMTQHVVEALRTGPCVASARALAKAARAHMEHDEHGHPDDLTMIVYRPTAQRPA